MVWTKPTARGVIHRELKQSNIMPTEAGGKLLDCRLARQTGGTRAPSRVDLSALGSDRSIQTEGLTEEGMILGTLEYVAPEPLEGEEAARPKCLRSLW